MGGDTAAIRAARCGDTRSHGAAVCQSHDRHWDGSVVGSAAAVWSGYIDGRERAFRPESCPSDLLAVGALISGEQRRARGQAEASECERLAARLVAVSLDHVIQRYARAAVGIRIDQL